MLSRQEIINDICEVALSNDYNEKQRTSARSLLESVMVNYFSLEEAQSRIEDIKNMTLLESPYWLDKFKSKRIYDSLKKYESNQLDLIEIQKMVSSIITHSLIELKLQDTANKENLGLLEFSDLLGELLRNEYDESMQTKLNDLLLKYGLITKKEGE